MRKAVITCAAVALVVGLAGPGWAIFKPRPAGPETCKTWDCEGGIICSCCFAGQGCWICDAHLRGTQPDLRFCHFDPKALSGGAIINNNPGLHFTPLNP